MSLLTQQTSANLDQFYFVKANGQQLNISTLNANTINANTISSNSIGTSSLTADYLSTLDIYADQGTISTFSTFQIVIDSQTLNATPTELLLNGIPVATQSSLSSIADWSLDPAISTVQMNGNDLDAAGTISSVNIRAGNGLFNNLVAFNSLFVSSNTSTISSLIETAEVGNFSTLNAGDISTGNISSFSGFFQSSLTTDQLVMPAGTPIRLLNGGASYVSPGSASVQFNWDPAGALGTHAFYDTTISSVRFRGYNGGSYDDTLAVNVLIPDLQVSNTISTPALNVSSINGSEFTSTGIVVQVAGVSSLVANSISSIGAEIRNALVSTIQFKPSFDLKLNFDTAAIGNALQSGLSQLGIGVGAGLGIVGSGLLGAIFSRPSNNNSYNTNQYYQYATPTQLQFSTLGATTSTFFRYVSSSGAANEVPGQEIIISSIISANTLCVRSLGDPTNLADPSTFTSTIQAFGEWVPVPIEVPLSTLSTIEDWAVYPAISTINFSTGVAAVVAASPGSDIALSGSSIKLIGGYTDAYNLLLVSSISTGTILGANDNLFGLGIQGLEIRTAPTGQVWISSPQTNVAGLLNTSTTGALQFQGRAGFLSTANISSAFVSTLAVAGLSSIVFSTAGTAGAQTQPAGRLMIGGNDLDLGQQDLWAQQVRIGAANTGITAELILYQPDNGTKQIFVQSSDRTMRIATSALGTTNQGYFLDSFVNPPIFSTINNSTCMMSYFPSTNSGTIGVSTLAVIPPIQVYGGFYSSTSQTVAGANTITPLTYNSQSLNVGGLTYAGSTIVVPIAGTYEITHSIQFDTSSGGTNEAYFWLKKNGTDIPQSASIVSIVNNGDTLGTISLLDTAAAGDQYAVCMASADANMTAKAVGISSFFPAIPSLITNIKRL
jgi:hypothetical protein